MLSAFTFGQRGGADPVTRSVLGWSAILWLTHIQRGDVCIAALAWEPSGLAWECTR